MKIQIHSAFSKYIRDGVEYPEIPGRKEIIQLPSEIIGLYVIMNDVLNNYIEKNKVCSELLFKDWTFFLKLLFENGGRIESILWFDYCKISKQDHSLGSGGYKDKENPGYMWSETSIYVNGFEDEPLEKILDYICKIRKEYSEYNLYPLFYLTE